MCTIQKAPLLVFFIGLLLSQVLSSGKIEKKLIIYGGLLFFLLVIMQAFYSGTLNFAFTFFHAIFRLAHAAPFYYVLYPDFLSFQGFNYGLGLLGVMTEITDNLRVMEYMYAGSGVDFEGSATAAAHIRGYTHGGWHAYVSSVYLVSLVLGLVNWFIRFSKGPILFSLAVQGLICAYFLSQTSFRGAVLESYGYIWAFVVLFAIFAVSDILPTKPKRGVADV